ncbi:MAG: tetratricopeptide repeat protein [Bacteroidales bacterium]
MRLTKNIVIGLLMLIAYHSYALGQNRIDSLRSILDRHKVPDSIYVKTSVELCKAIVNTDNEFLLPEYAIKGLEADKLNRDIQSKFALYEYLGNYYWQVGKLSEAADQFNHMRLIGEISSDTHITANSFNGLGTVYYLMDDYDQALEYYHQSHQNFRYLSIVYGNIALAYELHNSKEIRRNLNLALEAAIKADDPYQITSVYVIMGDLAFEQHPNLAVKSYSQALELARKSQSYDKIQKTLKELSLLSEKAGKYKEAIAYLREIKVLDDSLDLEQRKSRIRQMETEHRANKKESGLRIRYNQD